MCAVTLFAASFAAAAPVGLDERSASADNRAALERRFDRIDRNDDGLIAANEAPRLPRARCGPAVNEVSSRPSSWLDSFDADGDRRVSLQEFLDGSNAGESAHAAARPE